MIKHLYAFFLGALIAIFIALGIEAFYPKPLMPEYPIMTAPLKPDGSQSTEDFNRQRAYEIRSREFQKETQNYNKMVSIISIVLAVILVGISVLFVEKILIISDGILLGGIFTLIYAIGRGFGTGNEQFHLIVVGVGLLVALFVGYWKFVKPQKKSK